jgi:hypothetical protein
MREKSEPEKTENEPRHWLTPRLLLGIYAVVAVCVLAWFGQAAVGVDILAIFIVPVLAGSTYLFTLMISAAERLSTRL